MKLRALWPLLVFGGLILAFAVGLTRDPRILPSELIDRPFPSFALENLEGDAVLDESPLQGQVSLVNVFGSWCVSCEIEHPQLMMISQTSLQMVGIDWRDTRENANRWLARNGNPYDTIIFDADSALIVELGVAGAPESFIVDAAGRIRYKHVGIITAEDWRETLQPIVKQLRQEVAP